MSRLFSITLWVCIGLSIPTLFIAFGILVLIDATAGIFGIIFSALYLALVIWLLSRTPFWPDFRSFRRTPGGTKRRGQGSTAQWVIASLLWGACASFGIVMLMGLSVMELTDKLNWDFVSASFGGAYPEEIAKSLGVAIIVLSFRQLNRPWHGFVTGALVGLGFEVNENLLYGATGAMFDPNSDLGGMLYMWQIRTVAGPLIHTILTAFAGYGIGLAFFRAGKTMAWRWGVALSWIGIAFALHFVWNFLWDTNLAAIINAIVVALIMYPLAGYLIWRNWREARSDQTYGYAPGVITSPQEMMLFDAVSRRDPRTPTEPEAAEEELSAPQPQ